MSIWKTPPGRRCKGYTGNVNRRLIAWILLLALASQGPAPVYSAFVSHAVTIASGTNHCATDPLPNGTGCDGCCSHDSGSCTTACALSLGAVIPTSPVLVVATLPRLPASEASAPALVERHPARLLRPPIV
jgi:hypothetical protein